MEKKNKKMICPLVLLITVLMFANACKKEESKITPKTTTVITWDTPADIRYGTLLTATQLNATANIPGTFVYTPDLYTKLDVGPNQDLRVDFKPTDSLTYSSESKIVKINVYIIIGDNYKGGKLAYVFLPSDPGYVENQFHGLVAAPTNQSSSVVWDYPSTFGFYQTTGAIATELGTGNQNTITIISVNGVGTYAAVLCSSLSLGGYGDWYMPSKAELNILYRNKTMIGGFDNKGYWSSSEYGNAEAWRQSFASGAQSIVAKETLLSLRAIRSF